MTGVSEIASKYASELTELKCNSKPLINSLTMMAEDYIRHAPTIVEAIENHLRRVKPEMKLPVLYLIDSIAKNVKKEYVPLFSQNIVQTFTQTFEQVPDKTRTQMWKLRQTWNDVFSTKKLYLIDFKCHQTDPGWPITAAPPTSATSIHVNPKFLPPRALTISPATATTPSVVTSTVSSPALSIASIAGSGLGALNDLGIGSLTAFTMNPPGDITEAQMREQLLLKQKELLELQTKKLELELLHTKAQLEERTRKQQAEASTQQQQHNTAVTIEKQLLQQAEMAKHQTDIATSLLLSNSVAVSGSPTTTSVNSIPTTFAHTASSSPSDIVSAPLTVSSSSDSGTSKTSSVYVPDPRTRRGKDSSRSSSNGNHHHHHHHHHHHKDEEITSQKIKIKSESPVSSSSTLTSMSSTLNISRSSPVTHNFLNDVTTTTATNASYPVVPLNTSPIVPISSAIVSSDPRRRKDRHRSPEIKVELKSTHNNKEKDRDQQQQIKDKSRLSPTSNSTSSSLSSRSRSSPISSGKKLEVPSSSSSSPLNTISPIREIKKERSSTPPMPTIVSSSDPRKRKHRESNNNNNIIKTEIKTETSSKRARDELKDTKNRESRNGRKSTLSPVPVSVSGISSSEVLDISPLDESPSKRRKKSSEKESSRSKRSDSREKDKEKEVQKESKRSSSKIKSSSSGISTSISSNSSSSSSRRRRRDSENSSGKTSVSSGSGKDTKESKETKDTNRGERNRIRDDDLKIRKNTVLGKNYRRRTYISEDESEEVSFGLPNLNKKDKDKKSDNKHGEMSTSGSKTITNDIDLRFEGLKDVDLRSETSGMSVDSQAPPVKKSRSGNANLIDDLFGREDVDLRSSSSWSQVKRTPSITGSGSDVENFSDVHDRKPPSGPAQQKQQRQDEDQDIRDILKNRPRPPPPAVSPASSIDSNRTSTCDPLGRPLLYNRLPDDPSERRRKLDSIDPLERFRSQYLERPNGGDLTEMDLQKAARQAQQEFEMGFFTREQYAAIMRQLMQIFEVRKIQDVQQRQQQMRGSTVPPGPNPWTESENTWAQFGPRGPTDFGTNRFSFGPWGVWGAQPQQQPPPQPRGPNPFEEAAAAAAGIPNIPKNVNDDLIPIANMMELETARKDTSGTIPIDKVLRQVRFYGEQAVVLQGMLGDEPRDISFRKTEPKNVFIDTEREPVRCSIGKPVLIYLDRKKHMLQLGTAPTRELYIDGDHYEACYGGPPLRVRVDHYVHSFKIHGPPPQVEVGKVLRHDLLAGRVNLFVDGNSVTIYLDEKPQVIDLCGFPVILRFCDGFHTVLLNGRPFPTNFGGLPMSVTVPSGRKHYLRFSGINDVTRMAMLEFIRVRDQKGVGDNSGMSDIPPFGVPFHARGGALRGRGPGISIRGARPAAFNAGVQPRLPGSDLPHVSDAFHPSSLSGFEQASPLDVLATIMPSQESVPADRGIRRSLENSYESDTSLMDEKGDDKGKEVENSNTDIKKESGDGGDSNSISNALLASSSSLDVQDLLSKLMMAGLLPTSTDEKKEEEKEDEKEEEKEEESTPEPSDTKEKEVTKVSKVEKNNNNNKNKKKEPPVIPPLETVDVQFDKLKERREKLIATVCTGVQCGSCGLRFPPDQTVRYSQHLDWHFRQNRREKANVKKALSRKWYYDVSDWIQFQEIEDLEERAQSLFESQDFDMDGDQRSPGTVLNPDLYTVLSADHEGAKCPQCNEGFETFYDEEKEEWRLRDAHLAECLEEDGGMKLYHPICHQDYMACVHGKSILNITPAEDESMEISGTEVKPEEEDECVILQVGKPEPVVMELVEDETEEETSMNEESQKTVSSSASTKNEIELHDESITILEKDSVKQNETICINDDDDDDDNITDKNINNDVVDINNKIETETDLSKTDSDSSSISHTATIITTTTTTKNISSIDNIDNSNNDANIIIQSGDTTTTQNNNNNNNNLSSNISVNVLSPTLVVDLDDDTNDGALSSIPGITNLDEANINSMALSSNQSSKSSKIERYLPMKFDVPTPIIKEEPIDPDEIMNSGHLTLDQMIKANMTDEAQDGMELGEGELGEGEPTVNLPPLTVDLDVPTPPTTATNITTFDIDLTADDDEDSMAGALATLDGNFLLESTAPKAITSQTSKFKTGFRIHIQDAIISTDSMDSMGKKSPLPGVNEGTDELASVNSPNSQILSTDSQITTSEEKGSSTPTQKDDVVSSSVPTTTSEKLELSTDSSVNKNIVTTATDSSSIVNINTTTTVQQIESTAMQVSSDIVNSDNDLVLPTESEINEPDLSKLKPRLVGIKFTNVPPKCTGRETSGLCTIC